MPRKTQLRKGDLFYLDICTCAGSGGKRATLHYGRILGVKKGLLNVKWLGEGDYADSSGNHPQHFVKTTKSALAVKLLAGETGEPM